MRKLLGKGDIKVVTTNPNTRGAWIPPHETTKVLSKVKEATYVLYSIYRTFPFKESDEVTDSNMAQILGWSARKVRDHRLVLEEVDLFRSIRYGSKVDGITKVLVGEDVIALFDAGLPHDILDGKVFNKIKKELGITDVVGNISEIEQYYKDNSDRFK